MRSRNRQLLPAPTDTYIEVPGRSGTLHFPGGLQDRIIELDCAFMESDLSALRNRAREIAAWLYTQDRAILSFNDESDRYYKAKLSGVVDLEHAAHMGRFYLFFRCDPLAYGSKQAKNFNWFFVDVENPGTFDSLPIFKMMFAESASYLTVIGPDRTSFVKVVHEFETFDILDINLASGLIAINGNRALDKLDWENSRQFSLRPGSNMISVEPLDACIAHVSWIPRYL